MCMIIKSKGHYANSHNLFCSQQNISILPNWFTQLTWITSDGELLMMAVNLTLRQKSVSSQLAKGGGGHAGTPVGGD